MGVLDRGKGNESAKAEKYTRRSSLRDPPLARQSRQGDIMSAHVRAMNRTIEVLSRELNETKVRRDQMLAEQQRLLEKEQRIRERLSVIDTELVETIDVISRREREIDNLWEALPLTQASPLRPRQVAEDQDEQEDDDEQGYLTQQIDTSSSPTSSPSHVHV